MNLRITSDDREWSPKFYGIIVGLFCSLYIITNAINFKMIDLWGIILPAGIITFPLCAILSDIMTEVYGFNRTRQAIWTVLTATILQAIFTMIAISLPAANFWTHQESYATVFSLSFRFAIAGWCAWLAGEFMNSFIMSKMKILQNKKGMPIRFIGSTAVGQFFDTFVFMAIAFIGTMPFHTWCTVLLSVWIVKIIYEILALPLSLPATIWIKHLEGVDHFDRQKISLL